MIKKLISLILCMVSFPMLGTVHAADKTASATFAEALAVMNFIGAYKTPDSGVPENQNVTRGTFAVMAAKAFNLNDGSEYVYYSDVTAERSDITEINSLAEAGIISSQSRAFRPDDNITVAEAAKIMISAAGYDTAATSIGGFPNGYMKAAEDMDIMPIYADSLCLSYKEAIELIYNTLTLPSVNISGVDEKNNSLKYEKSEQRIINRIWDIYLARGILETCYTGSITDKMVNKNEVIIDGIHYSFSGDMNVEEYLADIIDFVYMEGDDADSELVYITRSKKAERSIEISSTDIQDFDEMNYSIRYETENRIKNVSLARNSKVIYNGSSYNGSISSIMDSFVTQQRKGKVRIKDSGNGQYDTLIINSFRTIVTSQADLTGDIYYNLANSYDNLKISDYQNVNIRTTKGTETTLTVTGLTVLSVAESIDKKYLQVIVGKDNIRGKVSSAIQADDETEITINNSVVKQDSSYPESVFPKIRLNGEYVLYLDSFGYVAYASTVTGGELNPGLLLDFKVSKDIDEESWIKIFTADEKIVKYTLTRPLKLDGKSYGKKTLSTDIMADIPGTTGIVYRNGVIDYDASNPLANMQIIRYRLDEEGKIKELDTVALGPSEENDNTLKEIDNTYNYSDMRVRWTSGTMRFGSAILYNSAATVIFAKPLTNSLGQLVDSEGNVLIKDGEPAIPSEDMYTTKLVPIDNESYMVSGYKYIPDSMYAEALLIEYDTAVMSSKTFVFDSQCRRLNEDDEVVTVASLWDQAVLKDFELSDSNAFAGISRGDLVRCTVGAENGKVYGVSKIYDYKRDMFLNGGVDRVDSRTVSGDTETFVPSFWWTGSIVKSISTGKAKDQIPYVKFQVEKGKAIDKIGSAIFWDWDGDYSNYEECVDTRGTVPILIIDRKRVYAEKDAIRKGTVAEIPTYRQVGAEAAQIVYVTSWWVPQCIYVYVN